MREAATTPVISWQVSQHQLQSLRDVNNAADMFVCGECPERFCKEALLCFLFVFLFLFSFVSAKFNAGKDACGCREAPGRTPPAPDVPFVSNKREN